ncbi:MAG: RNB domain-containing ribonuclease [Bacteroidaceae bacterium]|nr:RNB domain-containing ribonuclease [Bacteroidaceae bacterium]
MGKNRSSGKYLRKRDLMLSLIELFQRHAGETFDLKRLFRELKLTTHPLKMLCVDCLEDLMLDDYIKETARYCYTLNAASQVMEGVFHRKSNGKNTFTPDSGGEPILVAERNSMHAMDGDKVRASMLARRRNHVREAQVIEILQRSEKQFVGTLKVSKDYAYLLTEDRTLANDIFIPRNLLKNGRNGDKAVVQVVEWPEGANNPIGRVTDILGRTGENNAEMHAILAEYGLPYTYPGNVEAIADRIPDDIPQNEIERRLDMRDVLTFTIDPHDAKDFDDAISIRAVKESEDSSKTIYEVGVHIADVSYYVTEGSAIDKEARKRGTSVYLVDRTIPMLPERLCNRLCSLRPDEDKLTFSVIFSMNDKAEVKSWDIKHTVTRSNRRFSYGQVQSILEEEHEASEQDYGAPGDVLVPIEDYVPTTTFDPGTEERRLLLVLNRMAKELRRRRFQSGAVDFDRCEVRFNIDDKGKPTGVYFKVAKDANKLVEEFMLLANRTVAESIGKVPKNQKAKVLPYRIHDTPDPTKLMKLGDFVGKFGYRLKTQGTKGEISRNLNRLLTDIHGKAEQNVIEMVTLRTMMKAKYSIHNIGHYGLAFPYYTHFTSPIRRYPDLLVHRLLTRYAAGGRSVNPDKYEELCEQCSDAEQTAAQAERASIKYKQVEYMKEHLGETFRGTISGVTEFGLYVEVNENKCEGFVPLRDLDDDYYEFDEKNFCLRGRRRNNSYNLGDQVDVQVARADLYRKQLDYKLVGHDN